MKPKKITSCMLFAMIFSCGMSLQAANIKAVNFIHDNSIRGCDIHLSKEGNKYFADVYNQQQTIEMWVRISETLDAQGGVLISTKSAFVDDPANDNKSGGYELMLQPNGWARATFCVGNGGNEPKWVNTQLQAGEWAKLSMVIDGNKLICYKNGEKTVEETFSAPIAVGTGDLTLGANPNWVDGEKFQGMITDVRIWTVARTEEEIKSDLNYYFASKKENLFLNWNVQEGEGTTLKNLMHSSRNQASIVLINDMDETGIEWVDNSGCPIYEEGSSSIETARQKQAAYISGDNILIDGENINGAALYTIDGRLVMSISSHHNTIDISDLTPGYYIFKAIIDNNPVSLKLRK